MECLGCDLCITRKNMVMPIGNINANIVIISDYPRYMEDKTGIGYTSNSFKEFLLVLKEQNLTSNNVYFTHVLKCKPKRNEIEDYKELELDFHKCSKLNLNNEITDKMKLIVPLGAFVTNYLFGQQVNFAKVVNNDYTVGNRIIHPIYHPNFKVDRSDIVELAKSYRRNISPIHKVKL